MNKDIITLDIETIPDQRDGALQEYFDKAESLALEEIQQLKPPANIKDPAKIDLWVQNDFPVKAEAIMGAAMAEAEEKYRSTSFNGGRGRIAVIGYAINDEPPVALYSDDYKSLSDEASNLRMFYADVSRVINESRGVLPTFVGHNIIGFDFLFMRQRSMMLGIEPPKAIPFDAKPWSDTVYDTMIQWAGQRGRVKLSALVEYFDLQSKGEEIGEDIDGSMVWDFVRDGRIADVAKYCIGDVERTRAAYKRMTYQAEYEKFLAKEAA